MKRVTLIIMLYLMLVGCTKESILEPNDEVTETHDHQPIETFKQNENVLNCMRPSGHHVYMDDFTCPIGDESFKSLRLGTHSRYGVSLDWEPLSYMRFPVAIPICPANGMPIFKANFTEQELSEIEAIINSENYRQLYGEKHASFFLFGKVSEQLQENENL